MYILNVCCIVTLVSRGLSARHTPTYERPTSYYCLAGETAPQIKMRHFHQMDLLLIYGKRTESVAEIDPA